MPFDPPADWAAASWQKAMDAGIMTVDSDPWKEITKQEYAVFLDRQGYFNEAPPVEPPPPTIPLEPYRIITPTVDSWRSEGSGIVTSGQAEAIDTADGIELWNYNVDGSHKAGARLGFQNRTGSWTGIDNLPDGTYEASYTPLHLFDGESNCFQFKTRSREHGSRIMLYKVAINPAKGEVYLATRVQENGEWQNVVRYLDQDGNVIPNNTPILEGVPFNGTPFRISATVDWTDGMTDWFFDDYRFASFNRPLVGSNIEEYDRPREWVVSHYLGSWQGTVTPQDSALLIGEAKIWKA